MTILAHIAYLSIIAILIANCMRLNGIVYRLRGDDRDDTDDAGC